MDTSVGRVDVKVQTRIHFKRASSSKAVQFKPAPGSKKSRIGQVEMYVTLG